MKCYICNGVLKSLGTIPFGQNIGTLECTDFTPVEYHKCTKCNFICCLDMLQWDQEQFATKIYNEDYIILDPGYGGVRAKNVCDFMEYFFRDTRNKPKHLDYGSGEGFLSDLLKPKKWSSDNYDPFTSPSKPTGKYKLITAVEVFEHSTNIFRTIEEILSMLDRGGVILFTTKFGDSTTPIDWWYICARSGHIGILSLDSMLIIAKKYGLFLHSFSEDYHMLQSTRNNFKQLQRGDK